MAIDLRKTIEPKSDQLNADDLIAGAKTIEVTKVTGGENEQQPISIFFKGDNGKPYKPCKTMRRLLVQLWGYDATNFVGRKMTLYRDDSVKWAGVEVGGVRISHVSHIEKPTDVLITVSRSARRPVKIFPVIEQIKEPLTKTHKLFEQIKGAIKDGSRTIEQIESKFDVNEETKKLLTDEKV